MRFELFARISFVICSLFNIIALAIILKNPSNGVFEFSVYDVYPYYTWYLFGLTIFLGSLVLIINAIFYKEVACNWILGYTLLFISFMPFLFLSTIRNYLIFGRGDVLSHIGYIHEITNSGRIGNNMYPLSHILQTEFSLISSLDEKYIITIIPSIFIVIYIFLLYIFSKNALIHKHEITISYILGLLLYMRLSQYFPSVYAVYFIPLVVFLCFRAFGTYDQSYVQFMRKKYKQADYIIGLQNPISSALNNRYGTLQLNNRVQYISLIILMLITISFSHPLVCITLTLIFLIWNISYAIKKHILRDHNVLHIIGGSIILVNIILFFTWGSWCYLFVGSISRILGFLSDESQKSEFLIYSNKISEMNPYAIDVLSNIFYVYGQTIFIIFLCGILVAYTYYSLRFNPKRIPFDFIFYSFIFFLFCAISVIAFFLPLGFNFSRFLSYPQLVSLVLIPESISLIFELKKCSLSIKRQKSVLITIIIILILMTYICTATFYDSIRNRAPNSQISESEWFGMSTFFDTRNDSIQIYELGLKQSRFYDAIYHKQSISYDNSTLPLDHFGYINQSKQRYVYEKDTYILINTLGHGTYEAIFPDYMDKWKFVLGDFIKLNNDDSVYRIYSNSNLEVYLVNA